MHLLLDGYPVDGYRDDEGDMIVRVRHLPGCFSHGATLSEAITNLSEAKALWIEASRDAGMPIPEASHGV